MLFGVPDEITDMTRSVEMVEKERFIYRTMIFGHRKCSGKHRVLIGSPEGVPGTPGKRYGPYEPRGETHQPQRGWCTPHMGWPNWRRKGEGGKEKGNRIPPFLLFLPTPNRNRKGGRPNWEVPM